jgi:clan AA aspartic protease (TIGR02281 family)
LQADLEISLATKELKFFRPHGCGDSFLAYWDERAVVLPFNRQIRAPASPLLRATANPHFTVVIDGVKMDAIIDSGAGTTFVSLDAAKRAGLKLDAPGVTRTADTGGLGTRKRASWRTVFKRFEIGDEIVHNAEVAVVDHDGSADVWLGADFLRSHRVLFAMSQKKLYLSYIGGEPFGQRQRLEPWIVAEAEAGNADAQMVLSNYYREGRLVAQNTELADQWIEKAALRGNAQANIMTGHWLLMNSKYAEAAKRLRVGLDKRPTDHQAALDLYLARVHMGEAGHAKIELAQSRAANRENAWPAPITDFYLGKLGAAQLLEAASMDRKLAKDRTCESLWALSDWQHAHGDRAAAPALAAQRESAGCPIIAMTKVQPAPK